MSAARRCLAHNMCWQKQAGFYHTKYYHSLHHLETEAWLNLLVWQLKFLKLKMARWKGGVVIYPNLFKVKGHSISCVSLSSGNLQVLLPRQRLHAASRSTPTGDAHTRWALTHTGQTTSTNLLCVRLYLSSCKISPTLPRTRKATCTKKSETSACTRTSCPPLCPSPRPCLTPDPQIKGGGGDHQHALRFVQKKSCQLRALWFQACFALIAVVKKQSVDRADAILLQLRCNLLSQQATGRVRDPTDVGQAQKDSDLPFELRGELV